MLTVSAMVANSIVALASPSVPQQVILTSLFLLRNLCTWSQTQTVQLMLTLMLSVVMGSAPIPRLTPTAVTSVPVSSDISVSGNMTVSAVKKEWQASRYRMTMVVQIYRSTGTRPVPIILPAVVTMFVPLAVSCTPVVLSL